jgi:hypothetical protein
MWLKIRAKIKSDVNISFYAADRKVIVFQCCADDRVHL